MIIPIRTDYQKRGKPWVNYALVFTNLILFIWLYVVKAGSDGAVYDELIRQWMLNPIDSKTVQFITSMFLHASWAHVLGNMIFLWVFGNAINDKFGNFGYIAFYLAGGIIADVGYLALGGNSYCLGASGAIAAVTGAYLILLPRTSITVLVLLVYVFWPLELSSLVFIAFQFAFNLYMTFADTQGGVAHSAHTSGYIFGIVVALALIKFKLIRRDDWDIVHLYKHFKMRRAYRKQVAQSGYNPFGRAYENSAAKNVASRIFKPETVADQREIQLRQQIVQACNNYDLQTAADLYEKVISADPQSTFVLPQQNQLDVANQLMSAQHYPSASQAYELFVKFYPSSPYSSDIHLMLGRIYSRYFVHPAQAQVNLKIAIEKLRDERNIEMAKSELESLEKRFGQL